MTESNRCGCVVDGKTYDTIPWREFGEIVVLTPGARHDVCLYARRDCPDCHGTGVRKARSVVVTGSPPAHIKGIVSTLPLGDDPRVPRQEQRALSPFVGAEWDEARGLRGQWVLRRADGTTEPVPAAVAAEANGRPLRFAPSAPLEWEEAEPGPAFSESRGKAGQTLAQGADGVLRWQDPTTRPGYYEDLKRAAVRQPITPIVGTDPTVRSMNTEEVEREYGIRLPTPTVAVYVNGRRVPNDELGFELKSGDTVRAVINGGAGERRDHLRPLRNLATAIEAGLETEREIAEARAGWKARTGGTVSWDLHARRLVLTFRAGSFVASHDWGLGEIGDVWREYGEWLEEQSK